MGSAMTMGSTVTTYSRHSQDHAYTTASQAFLDRQPLGHVQRCLDIACGDGAVSQMLLERAPQASLMGLDIDPVQIRPEPEKLEPPLAAIRSVLVVGHHLEHAQARGIRRGRVPLGGNVTAKH